MFTLAGKILISQHNFSVSGHFENWTKIFHCSTSSGASECASEQQVSAVERANEASSVMQAKKCGASEQADERVAQY